MNKWEYRSELALGPNITDFDAQLNKAGSDGWELVSIAGGWLVFKRQLICQTCHPEGLSESRNQD